MVPALLVVVALSAAPLRVEAGVALGGDGTPERPFAKVSDALAHAKPGTTISIGPGLYEERLEIASPITLEGGPGVVLAAPPGAAIAVRIRADATLARLRIQGGRVGIDVVAGRLELAGSSLAGQPEVALQCAAGATCVLRGDTIDSSFASAVGVRVAGAVELHGLALHGPFRRAVEVTGALTGDGLEIEGANTGVHVHGGRATLANARFRGLRSDCLFGSAATLALTEPVFSGCEVAMELRDHATLQTRGALVADSKRAGISSSNSDVSVADSIFVGPASAAALMLLGGSAELADVRIREPGAVGIQTRQARIKLERVIVEGAQVDPAGDFGSALFLYDSAVSGTDLRARRCSGAAVEVQLGSGRLSDLEIESAGLAGVALEHRARLDLFGLTVRGSSGTGLACIEDSVSRLTLPRFEHVAQGSWLVDCSCHVEVRPRDPAAGCAPRP